MNILFIAFEYAPLNRGGVFRSVSFVEHLPKYGVNPIVITLSENSFRHVYKQNCSIDRSIGTNVLKSAETIFIDANEVNRPKSKLKDFIEIFFSIHGNEVKNWEKNFYSKMQTIIAQHKPVAIYATIPPFSILPLAKKVSKIYNLPLVIDFRDAWSQWRTVPYGTYLHYLLTLRYEEKYLKFAKAIIATSLVTINDFKRLHKAVSHEKYHYIPNGYNGQILLGSDLQIIRKEIVIGYVGSFYFTPEAREQMLSPWWKKKLHRKLQFTPYKQDWLYRSPYFFFKTMAEIRRLDPVLSSRIKIKFIGQVQGWMRDMIIEFELDEQVEILGPKTHKEALDFQKDCDLLLITSSKRIGGPDYSIAGKTFEYILNSKAILAFVSEGAQKDLLKNTGLALICDPDDIQSSSEKIIAFLNERIQIKPNYEFINELSREKLTLHLANVIKNIVNNK